MNLCRLAFGTAETSPGTDAALLLVRLAVGVPMVAVHGWDKLPPSAEFITSVGAMGTPAPEVLAWTAALGEFGGGVCLILGLATRPAAWCVAVTMAVAFFAFYGADPFRGRLLVFVYLLGSSALVASGGGRFALDRWLRR